MKSTAFSFIGLAILFLGISCSTQQENPAGRGENSIPYPSEEWKGVQGKTLADSKPYFVGRPKAPDGAPNVLIIMLDDAGYSNASS